MSPIATTAAASHFPRALAGLGCIGGGDDGCMVRE
jgi:hypothetical protein